MARPEQIINVRNSLSRYIRPVWIDFVAQAARTHMPVTKRYDVALVEER